MRWCWMKIENEALMTSENLQLFSFLNLLKHLIGVLFVCLVTWCVDSVFFYWQVKLFQNVGNYISGYQWDTVGENTTVGAIYHSYLLIWLLMQMCRRVINNANCIVLYAFSILHYCTTAEERKDFWLTTTRKRLLNPVAFFFTSVPVWSMHNVSLS